MKSHLSEILLRAAGAAEPQRPPPPQFANPPVDAPTCFDVLNGRGQGIQRHPGNVQYRKLVFLSKEIYAKCPNAEKGQISKGIVASIRNLGGRFLELDERSGTYVDIGDGKAYAKTSQALRDAQTRTRQKLRRKGAANDFDASRAERNQDRLIPPEKRFEPPDQVLESIRSLDQDVPAQASTAHQRARSSSFDQTPQTAPGSEGLVEQTPVERYVSPSPSHAFGNFLAAAVAEDEVRYMSQISYYELLLSMLRRADAEEKVRSRLLSESSIAKGAARARFQASSFGANTEACEL